MEVLTEVPQSGTKLRIDADRQFEQQQGDSVLRVQGQSREGSPIFDAAYVEVSDQEAQAVATILQWITQPTPELQDKIAQEVQAAFSSKLSGRDAQQIAHIVTRAQTQALQEYVSLPRTQDQPTNGSQHPLQSLSERFQRAAARKRGPYSGSGSGSGQSAKG